MRDFVAVARRFGWQARRVDRRDELDEAIAECLPSGGPFFLDVRVKAQQNCFPMIPPAVVTTECCLARNAFSGSLRCRDPSLCGPTGIRVYHSQSCADVMHAIGNERFR
ncbi:MAG: thiamine pyrophosphate-dependent enzyme [Burkholderiales bacterium]